MDNTMITLWHMYSTKPSQHNATHSVIDLVIRYNLKSKSKGPLLRTTHKMLPTQLVTATSLMTFGAKVKDYYDLG